MPFWWHGWAVDEGHGADAEPNRQAVTYQLPRNVNTDEEVNQKLTNNTLAHFVTRLLIVH
jgi:hypothetical protein